MSRCDNGGERRYG